jgi:hypothetical protein
MTARKKATKTPVQHDDPASAHAPEAERLLIGAMLGWPLECATKVLNLPREAWYSESFRHVCDAARYIVDTAGAPVFLALRC